MSIRNLGRIFRPKSVAVVGASEKPASVGYTVLHNLVASGFHGGVYPVNPRHAELQGMACWRDVASLPEAPDLAVVATPACTVPEIVRQCGERGVRGMVVLSAGFREIGEEGRRLEERVQDEAACFDGLRVLGPNCLGVIAPGIGLNASFAHAMPAAGSVAFVSQSGALCTSVLDWALEEGIGFSYFISTGNMLDVSFADLVDYLAQDAATRSIILYAESIAQAREFMSAARAFTRTKPIVAYKAGRFAESARAAASHTGALAGEDAVYDAAFQRAGIERVFGIDAMFQCAELLGRGRLPRGGRLAILTNAGGPGVMAVDALLARRGEVARLSETTLARLNEFLPPFWSHGNPVDVLGDASPDRFGRAAEILLADERVDALLVTLTPQAMTDPTTTARAVGAAALASRKPVLASWMGGAAVRTGVEHLNQIGIPTYATPEQAAVAFTHLVSYARNLEILHETPRDVPITFELDRQALRELFETLAAPSLQSAPSAGSGQGEALCGGDVLSESASKSLLEAYGISTTKPEIARSADEAAGAARRLGHPVVLKVVSPEITHKTDVGGVRLNLTSEEQVRTAYDEIVAAVRTARPDATIEGVTVQRMVAAEAGVELLLGAKRDPTFGAVVLVGAGGVAAEVLEDRALGLPPLNERLARRMLESLRTWPLITGYRGRPPLDLDALLETVIRFSYLVADFPEVREIDINPLLVMRRGCVGLDARMVIDRARLGRPVRPYAHLAIRPYPEEYVRLAALNDGTPLVLRPLKPEDESRWIELLETSTQETLRSRFRYLFKEATHEMAARYCFIDYDREMAIAADVEEGGTRKIAGVGRLVADPDHTEADYAVMVADRWQGRGIGSLLTDYCLEIARSWGVRRITAETTPENFRMIRIFRSRGFETRHDVEGRVVLAVKQLEGMGERLTGVRRDRLQPVSPASPKPAPSGERAG